MLTHTYRTELEFEDECPVMYAIYEFVESIKDTDVRWFFDVCYQMNRGESYCAIFKSYITEEYKDYVLSVNAKRVDNKYVISLGKKVDNLQP